MPIRVDTSQGGFDMLPPGDYNVVVTGVEVKDSKSSEHQYLNWELTVEDGDHEDAKLWQISSLSPKAGGLLKSDLVAMGADSVAVSGAFDLEPSEYIGAKCIAEVITGEWNDEERHEVKRLKRGTQTVAIDATPATGAKRGGRRKPKGSKKT